MGQQQLLLLVLGTVIVGLSVVVGINAFSENQKQSNADAMVTDALRIASDIQAYAAKPDQYGGGGGWESTTGTPPEFGADLGYTEGTDGAETGEYGNVNGVFDIGTSPCSEDPTSNLDGSNTLTLSATNDELGNAVCIGIDGLNSEDIATVIDYNYSP
jgi:hypothetical protein